MSKILFALIQELRISPQRRRIRNCAAAVASTAHGTTGLRLLPRFTEHRLGTLQPRAGAHIRRVDDTPFPRIRWVTNEPADFPERLTKSAFRVTMLNGNQPRMSRGHP